MSARSAPRAKALWLAAALALFTPASAQACDALIFPTSSTLRLDYDPFAFVRTVGRLSFEVENRESAACAVDIALLNAARVSVADTEVEDTGVRIDFIGGPGNAAMSATAVPGVWRVNLPAGRSKLSIEGVLGRDAVATAGEHAADLTLELRDAGVAVPRSTGQPVRIVLAALPRAQMNIVGAAATFGQGTSVAQIDFGEFTSNATRRVFLQVRANTRARLTIDSANAGRLLRQDSPAEEQGIPYAAKLVDEPIDMTRHWEREIEPPRTIAGTSLPLDLTLGTVGAHAAGTYSDVLTLELSAI